MKVEPGVAIPLTQPQSDRFQVGGGQTVKALFLLTENLDVGPSITFLTLPTESGTGDDGTAWTFGAGLRARRSRSLPDDARFAGISPWADADLLYVRTGPLNRPGLAAAVGLAIPVGQARVFWIGPFVRYLHILQGERAGFDDSDAKILSVGLSLEFATPVRRQRESVAPVAAAPEVRTVNKEIFVCADRDGDTVPDSVDHCPDVAGPMEGLGCPEYKKIIVKRDKLELKEKLFFAWNQAVLQEVSFPVLDEVVQALKENKGFKVQIEGHTSSEGEDEHNQTLSEQRARTVLDYLSAHGIEKDRLSSKGFGASVPLDSNATAAGREKNRRVEFVVNFVITDGGSK